jgi:tRNA A-37 threonylcarbamoyl transferase component Bud32
MRVGDCEMLDVAPEPGAMNYRVRHRRTGDIVSIHILNGQKPGTQAVLSLMQGLPPDERSRVLDHGQEGPLTYFVTQGLPEGEGFLGWLNRYSDSGTGAGTGAGTDAGSEDRSAGDMTPARMHRLRELFESAAELPPEEQAAYVAEQCAGDRLLEARVLRMLGIGDAGGFLDNPPVPPLADAADTPSGVSEQTVRAEPLESEFAPGVLIDGRYLVEREVGRGGFGIIYLAHDRQLNNREVVLKVRRGDADPMNPDLMKRFRREVNSLALIAHPSVVGVLDVGQTEKDTPYFVMPYVPGLTLRQKLKAEGPLPLPRVAAIVRQISHALSLAHDKGICHRDLKPENIMLQDLGDGEELPIIIDFGIATMKENNAAKTVYTRAIGTMAYMPPEQKEGRPTAASDTYALGVMTFEMIAGRRPDRSFEARPQKLSALRRGVPKEVEPVITKAISPNPADRQKRTRDFGDEVWVALQPSNARRRDRFLGLALVLLLSLCVGLTIALFIEHLEHASRH